MLRRVLFAWLITFFVEVSSRRVVRTTASLGTEGRTVIFKVTCGATKAGQGVFVTGNLTELGAWIPEEALPLTTSAATFPVWWSQPILIPADQNVALVKIIVQNEATPGTDVNWEKSGDKVVDLSAAADGQVLVVTCAHGNTDIRISRTSVDFAPTVPPVKTTSEALTVSESFSNGTGLPSELEAADKLDEPITLKREGSRFLTMADETGQIAIDMRRTPSLMLMDPQLLEAEAGEKELDLVELERERLNKHQRHVESGYLLEEMKKITDFADPAHTVLLQGFNWESHKSGKGNWYGVVESQLEFLADSGITDIWLPPPSQSVAPQGYLPSQLFNLNSAYGSQEALEGLINKMHEVGIRAVCDIVINHRCGDKQDGQGRWNVFTSGMETRPSFDGVMDWQGWAVTQGTKYSDGSGEHGPGKYDQNFDAAPDIDHANKKVQQSISIWLRWLRLQVGFDAWRFDFVKGYGAEYVGLYVQKSEPAWAVGELWGDMAYDDSGLQYNQDRHRQDLVNWVNANGKLSAAFDFTTKGILQEAMARCQYWRLKDSRGKPPGLIGWMPKYAVTFIDNHDTGSTQGHWPFPGDKVMAGYAYILTHPGIPSIFWDHLLDWGDEKRKKLQELLRIRRQSGISVDAPVNIKCADHDLYVAEIGKPPRIRVALGPRWSDANHEYWTEGLAGDSFRVWYNDQDQ